MKSNSFLTRIAGLCMALCLSLVASHALADFEEDAGEDTLPQVDPGSPLYWSEMRDIYTFQKRAFEKEGRFAVSFYTGLIPNNIFEQYFPIGLRLNYFILENIGVELSSSYNFVSRTNLTDMVQDDSGVGAQAILIGDTQLSHTNFGVLWSPFYGKFSFYESGLYYFDMYLFAGAGLVITETTSDFGADPSKTAKPEGSLGGGMAVYLGEHAGVRLDFRQFVFQKVAGIGGVANPSEVSLGFSWFF
ncbi:MAG: outer membrane beta-barrel domain-containing protein [Bradymonadaceae bacterium]